ncbi:MAG: HAD family hydrolase [Mycobacteriales bacterium]
MTVTCVLDGRPVDLSTAVFDLNGTLTLHGVLIDGVAERLARLRAALEIVLLSSDSYGTLAAIADALAVPARRADSAEEKIRVLGELGPARCVAIGNGANDRLMLGEAALGIAVIGPEGAARDAIGAADIVCVHIVDALDLLLHPERITATLRR